MVPRPLARARAMRSPPCADVIQPCGRHLESGIDPGNEVESLHTAAEPAVRAACPGCPNETIR